MDSQVDFFNHKNNIHADEITRDSDTELITLENMKLQNLVEQLCQQIHEIQFEKESVRLRLLAVENDYESQMRELQFAVINLREEVQTQKLIYMTADRADREALQSLTERNTDLETRLNESTKHKDDLSSKVKELQQQLIASRTSIQSHVHQIESMRAEICQLKQDKASLEKKLQAITEERDCILNALSDAQQTTSLLQRENTTQQAVISHQDSELINLQEAAAVLQEQLETLGSRSSPRHAIGPSHSGTISRPESGIHSHPHQSLLGELFDADAGNEDAWWYKHVQLNPTMAEFYEDDGIEIDDASLLAINGFRANSTNISTNAVPANTYNQQEAKDESMIPLGMACSMTLMDFLDSYTEFKGSEQPRFMNGFRTEVAEIYQQLQQMCVDLSSQSSSIGHSSRSGDLTPDQLALVEWDHRLSSLRNVLTDLRCLLQDLVVIPSGINDKQPSAFDERFGPISVCIGMVTHH